MYCLSKGCLSGLLGLVVSAGCAWGDGYNVTALTRTGSYGSLPIVGSGKVYIASPYIGTNGEAYFVARTEVSGTNGPQSIVCRATASETTVLYGEGTNGVSDVTYGRHVAAKSGQQIFWGTVGGQYGLLQGSVDGDGNAQPAVSLNLAGSTGLYSPLGVSENGFGVQTYTSLGFGGGNSYVYGFENFAMLTFASRPGGLGWYDAGRIQDDGTSYYMRKTTSNGRMVELVQQPAGGSATVIATAAQFSAAALDANALCVPSTGNRIAFNVIPTIGQPTEVFYEWNNGIVTQLTQPGDNKSISTNSQGDYAFVRNNVLQVLHQGTTTTIAQVGDHPFGAGGPVITDLAVTTLGSYVGGNTAAESSSYINDAGQVVYAAFLEGPAQGAYGMVVFRADPIPDCAADFNHDSAIDFFDYLDFVNAFSSGDSSADFNHDSSIDFFDYLDFVNAFSTGC